MKRKLLLLLVCLSAVLLLCVNASAVDVTSETALRSAIEQGADVKLQSDITLNAPLTVEKTITLDLGGKKLTYTGSAGSIITVNNATLTIIDSGVVYNGSVRTGGNITSNGTATSENGGGLYIGEGGSVVLNGGEFFQCVAKENGGGVYVAQGGKLCITGDSTIGVCKASNGGGVYVDIGGTLEMDSGLLQSCYARCGGGVYVNSAGTFTMTGGDIIMCHASGSGYVYGGGVYVTSMGNLAAYGEPSEEKKIEYGFRMSGNSSILSCSATSTGGGVSNAYGGGVYVGYNDYVGVFVMEGDSNIENCMASAQDRAFGGGVCVDNITTEAGFFKMTGGRIWNCEAVSTSSYSNYAHGGGVCVKSGVFEMTGGQIESTCKSTENGSDTDGGVCIGSIDNHGIMQANGGIVECTVMNHYRIECTISGSSTVFNALVKNDYMDGVICGGTFRGEVDNLGSIDGGEFFARVDNHGDGNYAGGIGGTINGGMFHGSVDRSYVIAGGTFEKKPQYAYYVTFEVRGGEPAPEQQVRLNAPATEPPVPTKGNQTFLGWYTDEACTQPYHFTSEIKNWIRSETTLYALWSGDRCTMTFDSNGGSEVQAEMGLFSGGTAPEPIDPTKKDATFLGWFTESGTHWNFTHDTMDGDITLYAMWSDSDAPTPPEPKKLTVSFIANGGDGDMDSVTVTEDTSYRLPSCAFTAPEGKAFDIWEIDGAKYGEGALYTVTANTEVKALWKTIDDIPTPPDPPEPRELTVSFVANGGDGSMDSVTVAEDTSYRLPSCAFTAPESKAFDIWEIDGAKYGEGALYPVTSNTEVKALWKTIDDTPTPPDPPEPRELTVSFVANGGDGSMDSVTVAEDTSYRLPSCAFTAPEGKTFDIWEIDGAKYGEGALYPVTSNTEVKALWKNIGENPNPPTETYSITISPSEGGTVTALPTSAEADTPIRLIVTPESGCYFEHWRVTQPTNGLIISPVDSNVFMFIMPESNVVIQAVFAKDTPNPPEPTEFTVTFDANGGETDVSSLETEGGTLPFLPGATRSGQYRFTGWYTEKTGGSRVTKATEFYENATVYAHWARTGSSGSSVSSCTIEASAGAGGSITPEGSVRVRAGSDQTFTITPDKGYAISSLKIDGRRVSAVKSYTFESVRSAHTIEVEFARLPSFNDVPADSYFYDAVNWAVETGVTTGTGGSYFSPDGDCTRAQAVTFLWRAAGSPKPESREMPFADVPKSSYFYDAVLWAVEAGITNGTGGTSFSPGDTCTRAQIAVFLWRSEGAPRANGEAPFEDVFASDYYYNAVLWAVKTGITKGTGGTSFSPDVTCTRAQIVTFLWRCKSGK